jgi:hypothetical protein
MPLDVGRGHSEVPGAKKTMLRAFHGGEIKDYRLSLAPKFPVVLYTESVESFDRRRKERQGAAVESNGP